MATDTLTTPLVLDDVLADPRAYRAAILEAGGFHTIDVGPALFHGMAFLQDFSLPAWIAERYPHLTPERTFLRQSPAGQVEPNYIHSDVDMGEWTGIFYLTPDPPAGDGTVFWRHRHTGAMAGVAADDPARVAEALAWRDPDQWARWHHVEARFNRLLLFPSAWFHSRAIADNYGEGATARLVQLVFGVGTLVPSDLESTPCV